jgi:4-deoxy-L-threo-5-hexosulose-uronate ketol-isomerase
MMEVRYSADQVRMQRMNTAELRQTFLLDRLFQTGQIQLVYSEIDRAVVGAAAPTHQPLKLAAGKELAADRFCERRELGVINVGQPGTVQVDGQGYTLANRDALYVGRGSKEVIFASADLANPAAFYLLSYPAHAACPTTPARKADAEAVTLGTEAQANVRTIYKYIHPGGIKSCQLVMGFTELAAGSVWNTMPPHTHERRSEVYLYFDVADDTLVYHFMGRPDETRHIVVRNRQAVIAPSWSIHSGAGTANYSFVWGMGGENQVFGDMDAIDIKAIR